MEEHEFTIDVPTDVHTLYKMKEIVSEWQLMKTFAMEGGVRIRFDQNNVIVQKKVKTYQKASITDTTIVDGAVIFLNVAETTSTETPIEDRKMFVDAVTKVPVKTINNRVYVKQLDNLRVSVDSIVSPIDSDCCFENVVENSFNESHFLRIEWETDSRDIGEFMRVVKGNCLATSLLTYHFRKTLVLKNVLKTPPPSRSYWNHLEPSLTVRYTALKLDGVRHVGFIFNDCCLIPDKNKTIRIKNLNVMQVLAVFLEEICGEFFLIDIFAILNLDGSIYKKVSSIEAIPMIQFIDSKNIASLKCNKYYMGYLDRVPDYGLPSDGLLYFTEKRIIKCKGINTIDLIYKDGKFLLTDNVEFSSIYGEYSIMFDEAISKTGNSIRNFVVVEFNVVEGEKKILFNRFRFDKTNANCRKTLDEILK